MPLLDNTSIFASNLPFFTFLSQIYDKNKEKFKQRGGGKVILPDKYSGKLPAELVDFKVDVYPHQIYRNRQGAATVYDHEKKKVKKEVALPKVLQRRDLANNTKGDPGTTSASIEALFERMLGPDGPIDYYYAAGWQAPAPTAPEQIAGPSAGKRATKTPATPYALVYDAILGCSGIFGRMVDSLGDRIVQGFVSPKGVSAFPLHREDEFVFSLNFNFSGNSKVWMFIPVEFEPQILRLGEQLFADEWPKCGNPLAHFHFFLAPSTLRENNIPYFFEIQQPGEAILTTGLHQGLNMGEGLYFAGDFGHRDFLTEFNARGSTARCECPRESFILEPDQVEEIQGVVKKLNRRQQVKENTRRWRAREAEKENKKPKKIPKFNPAASLFSYPSSSQASTSKFQIYNKSHSKSPSPIKINLDKHIF